MCKKCCNEKAKHFVQERWFAYDTRTQLEFFEACFKKLEDAQKWIRTEYSVNDVVPEYVLLTSTPYHYHPKTK